MPKVKILPPEVISKIAAGEVIERPASVIKEILENALDADSDSVEIELDDSGKTLICLKDNGTGIAKGDLTTIFQRHSTSKIESFEDLFNIHSLGFRGEALYSIAAVADVVLRSKTQEQDSGWEIHMRGGKPAGKKGELKPVPMNDGTEIEIRELFFNTPARKKFLKSDTAELNQILNIVIPHSLLHHKCRLTLVNKGKEVLSLLPAIGQKKRIAKTLNIEEGHLIETEHTIEATETRIKMFLGDINLKRSSRDMQFIFVNGRPVQSKNISFHMNQVYHLLFPPKTHPVFAVFIQVPPDIVDVNIHPTKREVKIKNENNLGSILRNMAEQALMTGSKPQQAGSSPAAGSSPVDRALRFSNRLSETFPTALPTEIFEDNDAETPSGEPYSFPHEEQPTMFEVNPETLKNKMSKARYIGSFINKFLLFESGQSLMLVDQHAAQERIVFEQLCRQMQEGKIEVQRLLTPIVVNLSPQEVQQWEKAKEKLNAFGFESTKFDDETIAVHTYPNLINEPVIAVRNLLSGDSIAKSDHATIARRACKASVRAGDSLTDEQADFQRRQLLACRDPFTCPHGRPTIIEMSENFLDKQFLRT